MRLRPSRTPLVPTVTGAAVALVVGLTLVPGALVAPAAAEESYATRVQAIIGPKRQTVGFPVGIVARVQAFVPDEEAPGGGIWVTVEEPTSGSFLLQWRKAGGTWRGLRTVRHESDVVQVRVRARENATYRLRYDGGTTDTDNGPVTLEPSVGDPLALTVTRRIRARVLRETRRAVTIRGRVTPGYAQRRVQLQRATCRRGCTWRTVQRPRTTARGVFTVTLQRPPRGRDWIRVVALRDARFARTVGAPGPLPAL